LPAPRSLYGSEQTLADPVPKPAAQRRRRNRVATTKVSASKSKMPALPADREWHPRTIACWKTVWASPVAAIWIDVDVLALERWAALLDLVHTGEDKTFTHQEIRMLEDRFGLSPLARRRLQWEIDQNAKPDAAAKDDTPDDGRFLRVVGGTSTPVKRRRRKAAAG